MVPPRLIGMMMMTRRLFTDDQIELRSSRHAPAAHLRDQFLQAIIFGLISSAPEKEFAGAVISAWEKVTEMLRRGGWDVLIGP